MTTQSNIFTSIFTYCKSIYLLDSEFYLLDSNIYLFIKRFYLLDTYKIINKVTLHRKKIKTNALF
jgi:hypothetical protein